MYVVCMLVIMLVTTGMRVRLVLGWRVGNPSHPRGGSRPQGTGGGRGVRPVSNASVDIPVDENKRKPCVMFAINSTCCEPIY